MNGLKKYGGKRIEIVGMGRDLSVTVAREGLRKAKTFEYKPEESEGTSYVDMWRTGIPDLMELQKGQCE